MKKKHIYILCAIISVILCVIIVAFSFTKNDIVAQEKIKRSIFSSTSTDDWKTVETGTVFLENDKFLFALDTDTTHFTVTDRNSGKVFSTVPGEDYLEDKYYSELVITYYDSNSSMLQMSSWANCVKGGSYEIKCTDDSICVFYSIRKSQKVVLVPVAFTKKVFEEEILGNLGSAQQRRLKLFYNLYESGNSDDKTKAQKEKYPALKEQDLYILGEAATETFYSEITQYMQDAEYTSDRYSKDMEEIGLDGASVSDSAAFTIPVKYTLTEDGFVAEILSDKITSESSAYSLTNISLLPYFSSSGSDKNGYFLIPDGSGAIVDLSTRSVSNSQKIYGRDYALQSTSSPQLIQNAVLPVFGCNLVDRGYLAIIEGAASVASVNMETCGKTSEKNHIYADFNVLTFDTSASGELRRIALFNIYASDYAYELPSVHYMLLDEDKATYSSMAGQYREYLIDKGVLKDRLTYADVPLYIDFTGYEQSNASILGISYKSNVVLSTISEITDSVKHLQELGIQNVNVRLKAYSNNGVYQSLPNGFSVNKSVGSINDLKALRETVSQNAGTLFIENNINIVFSKGNSFDKLTHAVRYLNKTVASSFDYDLVARKSSEAINSYFIVSPAYYNSLTEKFIKEFTDKVGDAQNYGYSWSNAGSFLSSDFNTNNPIDRTVSESIVSQALSKATAYFANGITDTGNLYTLKNVSTILNMPLTNSGLSFESYSVPFYQMAVHGYIDYAGAPINISTDSTLTLLKSFESGALPYYSCFTKDNSVLKNTSSGSILYPTSIENQYDHIKEIYEYMNGVFSSLRTQVIVKHEMVDSNVFKTTYEDGTEIVVNYNSKDIIIDNQTVKAGWYSVLHGQEGEAQ